MRLYGYDIDLQVVELGEATPEAIEEQIERCAQNASRTYESAEEHMMDTSFGISRSDGDFDFLDISWVGQDLIMIYSDRVCYPKGFFRRLFCGKSTLEIRARNLTVLRQILEDYTSSTRSEFEEKYSDWYAR